MSFYAEMAGVAAELMGEFGQVITVNRTTGGSIDPVTGTVTPGATTTLTANGVLRPYPDALIDGTRITASDRMLVMEASC